MPLNTAKIDDYSGGLNLIAPPDELEGNEFDLSTGVEISEDGKSLYISRPITELSVVGLPTDDFGTSGNHNKLISNMKTFRLNQTVDEKVMCSNNDGHLGVLDVTGLAYTTLIAGAATAEWEYVQAADAANTQYVWCLNGTSTPQKYNIGTSTLSAWGGSPPNGTCLRVWKNMMVVGGVASQPQRLYYSKIADPETWTSPGGFIDIKSTDDEMDAIIALEVLGENLLVFKTNSVWLVFDPVSFDNRRIDNVGILNHVGVAKYDQRVYWLNIRGVYSTDGDTVLHEAKNIYTQFSSVISILPTFGRIAITQDGVLVVLARMSQFRVFAMRLGLKRDDGQHPWFNMGNQPLNNCSMFVVGKFNGGVRDTCIGITSVTGSPQKPATIALPSSGTLVHTYGGSTQARTGQFFSRWMAIQGTENKERIRRVNLVVRGVNTATIKVTVYVDLLFATGAFYSGSLITFTNSNPQVIRVRPETRAQYHQVVLDLSGWVQVRSIEIKYRGGKEH